MIGLEQSVAFGKFHDGQARLSMKWERLAETPTSNVPRRRGTKISRPSWQDAVGLAKLKTFLRKAPNGAIVAAPGLLLLDCSHKGAVGVEESAVISGASSEFVRSDTNDQNIYDTSDYICRCSIG